MPETSDIKSDLIAFYDAKAADRVTSDLRPDRTEARARFTELLSAEARRTVLDLGAGTGQDADALRDAGLEPITVDLSVEHARWCRSKGHPSVAADFYHLPFRPAAFQAGWAVSALVHVPDRDLPVVLEEIRRVLEPGAPFLVGLWGGEHSEGVHPEGDLRRFYSIRPDERAVRSIDAAFEVEDFWTQSPPPGGDRHYQWIICRRRL